MTCCAGQPNGALFTFTNGSSIFVEHNTVATLLDDILPV